MRADLQLTQLFILNFFIKLTEPKIFFKKKINRKISSHVVSGSGIQSNILQLYGYYNIGRMLPKLPEALGAVPM
jgi:hypothetical protein